MRKSLIRSYAIRNAMTTIVYGGCPRIYIQEPGSLHSADRHPANYQHRQPPPSFLSISALPPADILKSCDGMSVV